MTDFELLKKAIEASGMPITVLSERTGIRRETLYNRFKGIGAFTAVEITSLCNVLRINKTEREKIFLPNRLN